MSKVTCKETGKTQTREAMRRYLEELGYGA